VTSDVCRRVFPLGGKEWKGAKVGRWEATKGLSCDCRVTGDHAWCSAPVVLVAGGNRGYLAPVKQYRPNVERQKMLYSMEKSRKVLRRWQGKPEGPDPDKPRIPDNSEPWLPGGVRSVADALWISDRIKETAEQWGLNKPRRS
jgi:hypothetical protein